MHPTWRGSGLRPVLGRNLNPSEVESGEGSDEAQVERQVEGKVEVQVWPGIA